MRCFLLSLICLCTGCTTRVQPDNRALTLAALELSGENRGELEKVLAHYATVAPDSLKLEAAYFLIGNMPQKYTYTAPNAEQYHELLHEIAAAKESETDVQKVSTTARMLDSAKRTIPFYPNQKFDLEHITADFLIADIDRAFAGWHATAWHTRYSFEDFCEWVLPYRLRNEELEDWRSIARKTPVAGEERLLKQDSMWALGVEMLDHTGFTYSLDVLRYPLQLRFSDMNLIREGACGEFSDYATRFFRSRGIPAATEQIPAWGNRSSTHAWNALVMPDGKSEPISYDRNGWMQLQDRLPKVYRLRYSAMRDDPLYRYRETESIPLFFQNLNMQDVTGQYERMPTIAVTVTGLKHKRTELAWLSCFNNFSWVPVAYAEIDRGKAVFDHMGYGPLFDRCKPVRGEDMEVGIVYLPAFYIDHKLVPAGDPILIREDRSKQGLVADLKSRQTITLTRKYPLRQTFVDYRDSLVGARFEGANRPDFTDAVALHNVERINEYPFENRITTDDTALYRYVRFCLPDSTQGNVAELRFLEDGRMLTGRPIGSSGKPQVVFDGAVLTFFQAPRMTGSWVGLDLGKPRRITSVQYRERTDDNDIVPGDLYELWYWNNGWQSMGQQVATGCSITWENVPSGALYWVRDLTKGVEQRIFTYTNGSVSWW